MKVHLRKRHGITDENALKEELAKCTREVTTNKKYINPGFFVYKGRSKVVEKDSNSSVASVVQTVATTSKPTEPIFTVSIPPQKPAASSRPPLLPLPVVNTYVPETTDFSLTSRISVQEYRRKTATRQENPPSTRDAHSGHVPYLSVPIEQINAYPGHASTVSTPSTYDHSGHLMETSGPQDASTQASCSELPPLVLPPVPETRHELESYIRWLCNGMDQPGRARESAKIRLDRLKIEPSRKQDRDAIRKLESENRELRRQLSELRWRDNVFRSMEVVPVQDPVQ